MLDKHKTRSFNSSKKFYTGSVWETSEGDKATIIAQVDDYYTEFRKGGYILKKYLYFLLRFEDGTIINASSSNIRNKNIKNPNKPSIYGVGFFGQGVWKAKIKGKQTKEYNTWRSMMERCYCEKSLVKHPTYKDCTVDERWHNFQNFCEDIKELEGYKEWKDNKIPRKFSLDKDIRVPGNRLYSKDTCIFVLHADNVTEMNKRTKITGKTYVAKRISDGYSELFCNIREFSLKKNLYEANVNKCLVGIYRQTGGWSFKIKDEEGET